MKKILLTCFMLVFVLYAWAQDRTVSGKVSDAKTGDGLPGVNVLLKTTGTGVVTDLDGNYKISVPADGGTLVFTFIGMKTQEVQIGSRSIIEVQMETDVQQLSEVVVTAFGIERAQRELAYSTEKVNSEEIMVAQQPRAASALAGKVAGLQINVQSNGVNPNTQINLRGLRSISTANQALVVIDGTIASVSAFDDLNPNDIASIDVLKGPSAAALYGSLASNGALIVTTKRGKVGDFVVGINSNYSLTEVAYMPDFQSEFGIGWDGHYDNIENTNWGPRFDGVSRQIGPTFRDGTFQSVPYAPIANNLRDFYNTGSSLQNTIYASGGDETGRFYISIGNQNTTGIVPDDEYERQTVKLNADKKIGKLTLAVTSTYLQDETDVVGGSIGDQDRPLYWFVLNTPANIPLSSYSDWENPESFGYADNYFNAYYQNPYWAVGTNRDLDDSKRFLGNVSANYEINENINLFGQLGINNRVVAGKNFRYAQSYDEVLQPAAGFVSSFVTDSESQFTEYNGQFLATFNYSLPSDLSLKVIAGSSFRSNESRNSSITANNLSIPRFMDISNGTGELQATLNQEQARTFGVFADATLGFRDYLFLNLTGRQDFTSTLGPDNNNYFYPAAGLSFTFTDAIEALSNNNILSYGKLTANYAVVYNDLGPYQINETFSQSNAFPLGSVNGFFLAGQTVDANITKEKLESFEVGTELGLLRDRFTLGASYYQTITTDLITATTPSAASGASSFLTNIGELENTGFDAYLNGTIVRSGDFTWKVGVNYTSYETVVNEIKDDLNEINIQDGGGWGIFAIKGLPFPQIKAQSYVRDNNGRVVVDALSGNPIVGEVTALGKTTPDYILGLTSSVAYKGITLSATADYRTGHVYYEQGSDAMEFTGRSIASVATDRNDFVFPNSVYETEAGTFVPNTNITTTGTKGVAFWNDVYNQIKENYVKDATALKIREVSLSYMLPKSILEKTGVINKLTVGVNAINLITWLPEENRFADPEFNNNTTNNNAIGVGGYFQSPPTRSFGVNVNIEF